MGMSLWLGFYGPIFFSFVLLNMILAGSESRSSMEQTQLDSSVLSACHTAKNHLNTKTASINRKILSLQNQMSLKVAVCKTNARAAQLEGGRAAYVAVLFACNRALRVSEQMGTQLELTQEESITRNLDQSLWDKLQRLIQKNQLDPSLAKVIKPKFASLFYRQPLGIRDQNNQTFISFYGGPVKWPRRLVAHSPLHELSEIELRYSPIRSITSPGRQPLSLVETKVKGSGSAHQIAGCSILEITPGEGYRVLWRSP